MSPSRRIRRLIEKAVKKKQEKGVDPELEDEMEIVEQEPEVEAETEAEAEANFDPVRAYPIEYFKTISQLRRHLSSCVSLQTDYRIAGSDVPSIIDQFLINKLKEKQDLALFEDSLVTLELVKKIEESQKRTYDNYENHLMKLLDVFRNIVVALFKTDSKESLSQLKSFFLGFNNNDQIKQLINIPKDSLNPFSIKNKIKDVLNFINQYSQKMNKKLERISRQSSQQDYAQLLDTMLEGGSLDLIPQVKTEREESMGSQQLLPENEYDVPYNEPDHPRFVGINKVYSFITDKERMTIEQSFCTEQLKKEFKEAFPWAADTDNLTPFIRYQSDLQNNLLGTASPFSAPMQREVVQVVLLSLDTLGKACGVNGEFAIPNYPVIKDIIDGLQTLSVMLDNKDSETDPLFINTLNQRRDYLARQNKLLYKNYPNPEMNHFCHVNEALAHFLLQETSSSSLLFPSKIEDHLKKKIENALQQRPKPSPAA